MHSASRYLRHRTYFRLRFRAHHLMGYFSTGTLAGADQHPGAWPAERRGRLGAAHVTKGLEMRMGSSRERNSTVPMAEDGSMGVNTKWLRGDTHTTSYLSVSTTCALSELSGMQRLWTGHLLCGTLQAADSAVHGVLRLCTIPAQDLKAAPQELQSIIQQRSTSAAAPRKSPDAASRGHTRAAGKIASSRGSLQPGRSRILHDQLSLLMVMCIP